MLLSGLLRRVWLRCLVAHLQVFAAQRQVSSPCLELLDLPQVEAPQVPMA